MLKTNKKKIKHLTDEQITEFVVLGLRHFDLNSKDLTGESRYAYGCTLAGTLASTIASSTFMMSHPELTDNEREKITIQYQQEITSLIHDWISLKLNKKEILV